MALKPSEILSNLNAIEIVQRNKPFESSSDFIKTVDHYLSEVDQIDKAELSTVKSNLLTAIEDYKTHLQKIKDDLKRDLFSYNEYYQKRSEAMWESNSEHMTFDEHYNWSKLWQPTEKNFDLFLNVSQRLALWDIPGVIIGAKDTKLFRAIDFVGPFYSVERYDQYFDFQKESYHLSAARRILWYNWNDVDKLPNNAIGAIIIYNEIPFMPFSMSSKLLKTLASKLYDGGNLLFNYNDCLTPEGFESFENESMMFTTSEMFDNLLGPELKQVEKYNAKNESFSFLLYQKNGITPRIKKMSPVGIIRNQPTLTTPGHSERLEEIRKLIRERNT